MARTNFKFQKRQKELAKQAKAEEKRLRKLEKRGQVEGEELTEPVDGEEASETGAAEETSKQVADDAV